MNTRPRAVTSAIVVVTLAAVLYWASLPTYQVFAGAFGPPRAIWNDDQLVVFVPSRHMGRSLTAFDRTRGAVLRLFGKTTETRWSLDLNRWDIVRYERGVVSRMFVDLLDPRQAFRIRARFFDGRLYMFGGVWTGRTLEPVSIEEQRRVHTSPDSTDVGPWNVAEALENRDVQVRLRGGTMILRTRRPAFGDLDIELLRPHLPPLHLLSLRAGVERTVSAAEYRLLKTP